MTIHTSMYAVSFHTVMSDWPSSHSFSTMLLQIICVSIFLLSEVTSDELSDATCRDMHNNVIQIPEYCEKKNCIVKCCETGSFILRSACRKAKNPEVRKLLNFSQIYVYREENATMIKTENNIESSFAWVQNEILSDINRSDPIGSGCAYILEDATVKPSNSCGYDVQKLHFCVDFFATGKDNVTGLPRFVFMVRAFDEQMVDGKSRHLFVIVGLATSSIFCILVLVVYALVPELRRLPGLIMISYLASFVATCILKIVQLVRHNAGLFGTYECSYMSPVFYYIMLTSFFWLNIMSIEVWRLPRKSTHNTTRRHGQLTFGEWKKFIIYSLYAWLTPALLTLLVVAVDKFELYPSENFKPPFEACFTQVSQTQLYLHVPIGIITITNTILFALAAWAIWKISQVNNTGESRSTKKNEHRFFTCLKVFVLTGATWILELLPNDLPFALYIIVNFYNMFVGVAIFYVLVCKKRIIIILCKRFNINNKFVNRLHLPSQDPSDTTSTTRLTNTVSGNDNRLTKAQPLDNLVPQNNRY